MALTSAEHAAIHRATKAACGAAARARRRAPVELIRAQDGATVVLVAISRSHAGAGYILRPAEGGGWQCGCVGFQWRGTCSHTQAAEAQQRGDTV